MPLDDDACWRAVRARDARFDGRFFTAVRTTRVYCRPICPAPAARRDNLRFYPSAAAAEAAGFRPCLRCRPELAPGLSSVDANARLARAAASRIDDGALAGRRLTGIARSLGVTDRHLRRVFQAEFGVTPVAYAQTARLLLAKRLLTDSALSVTDVAHAAGFRSTRRMHALFAERYRFTPSSLRKRTAARESAQDRHRFRLQTAAPFDFDGLLAFLSARAIDGVEEVTPASYRRVLRAVTADGRTHCGWIEVRRARANARRDGIDVDVDAQLTPAIAAVLAACKHVFDLDCRPTEIAAALGSLAATRSGLRLPGSFDGFELAVRAVLGQQITVRAARTLAGRFAAAFGTPVVTPFAGLARAFPQAREIAARTVPEIAQLGIVRQRAQALIALARAVDDGLDLSPGADVARTTEALRTIAGIGPWTANYIAMRALHWPDVFLPGDVALAKAMGLSRAAAAREAADAWRPWRSYAVMHLWKSLESR